MTRPRPIIVGFVALSALVIGVEVYGLSRSHRRAPPPVADEPPPAEPPLAAAPPPPAIVAPPPAPDPSPATDSPPARPLGDAVAAREATTTARRPLFVAPNLQEVIRDADEQAFETLKMPEATRAAIRRINDDHAKRVQALRDGAPVVSNQQPEVDATAAAPTRRAALDALLGPDAAQQFDAVEHTATKRLHNRYRWQSLHGVAPGTPPADAPTLQR